MVLANASASSTVSTTSDGMTGWWMASIVSLNCWRSSAFSIVSHLAPSSFTPCCSREALLRQLHGEGQTALPAQRGQQRVRLFLEDDAAQGFQRQRLNVDMVGGGMVGHDGRGVRVTSTTSSPAPFRRGTPVNRRSQIPAA